MVIDTLPSPIQSQSTRLQSLIPSIPPNVGDELDAQLSRVQVGPELIDGFMHYDRIYFLQRDIELCNGAPDAELTVFVSKIFAVSMIACHVIFL